MRTRTFYEVVNLQKGSFGRYRPGFVLKVVGLNGCLLSSLHTGGLVGGFFATNVGHFRPLGIDGWRFAFYFVAIISIIVSCLVLRFAADPRKKVQPFLPPPPPHLRHLKSVSIRYKSDAGLKNNLSTCLHLCASSSCTPGQLGSPRNSSKCTFTLSSSSPQIQCSQQ